MTRSERLLLFVLACLNFTHIIDFMIMMPMGTQLMRAFGIGPQAFSFLVSAYSLSAGISGFLAAFFVDRFPRKHVLMVAYAGFLLGTLACGMAPTYGWLVLARLLAGTFGGVLGAQVLSSVGDTFTYERRAQAMSIVMTAFSLASVLGVPAGLWLATKFSWHMPFFVIFGLGLIVLVLLWQFAPRLDGHLLTGQPRHRPMHVLTDILQNPNQLRALWLTTTIMLGHFSIIPFIAPYLVANAGYSEADLHLIYFVGGLLTIFTAPLVGRLADKQGKYPVFVVFALLSMIPIYLITNLQSGSMGVVLTVAGLFFIFSNGRLIPTQAISSSVVLPQQRGSFMSINSSVQLLAQAIATYGAGMLIQKSPSGQLLHYSVVGYVSMLAIFASVFIAKTVKPVN
jgi:MFS transporter, DHA1 family, inner membrane transport protein